MEGAPHSDTGTSGGTAGLNEPHCPAGARRVRPCSAPCPVVLTSFACRSWHPPAVTGEAPVRATFRDLCPPPARHPGSQVPSDPPVTALTLSAQFWEAVPCREASADKVLIRAPIDGNLELPGFLQDLVTLCSRSLSSQGQRSIPEALAGGRWAQEEEDSGDSRPEVLFCHHLGPESRHSYFFELS